jgi:ankyrin repeat protein
MSDRNPKVEEFMQAVRKGDLDTVRRMAVEDQQLLADHDNNCFGATALIHAAGACNRAMVDLLLELGADIDERSDWWAGGFGVLPNDNREFAEYLISRGATVDAHTAAHLGDIQPLRELLDSNPDLVNARGGDGQLPLHFASTPEAIDLLLEYGADLEARDIDHETTAAQHQCTRKPKATRHLIKRGAPADVFMAVAIGDLELIRALHAADPDCLRARVTREAFPTSKRTQAEHIYFYTIGKNATPLHMAAGRGQADVCRFLIEQGADVNALGAYDDCTPLHQAAWNGRVEAAGVLLDHGADIALRSGAIHTNEPLGWAAVAGQVEMVESLLQRGAQVQGYHIGDAEAGARRDYNYSNAPIANFDRIVELLKAAK